MGTSTTDGATEKWRGGPPAQPLRRARDPFRVPGSWVRQAGLSGLRRGSCPPQRRARPRRPASRPPSCSRLPASISRPLRKTAPRTAGWEAVLAHHAVIRGASNLRWACCWRRTSRYDRRLAPILESISRAKVLSRSGARGPGPVEIDGPDSPHGVGAHGDGHGPVPGDAPSHVHELRGRTICFAKVSRLTTADFTSVRFPVPVGPQLVEVLGDLAEDRVPKNSRRSLGELLGLAEAWVRPGRNAGPGNGSRGPSQASRVWAVGEGTSEEGSVYQKPGIGRREA